MNILRKKYFCIFGGGAVRGFSYIGAYRALLENNIEFCGFAGSSVGAIFGTFCTLGASPNDLEKFFIDVNFELFKDINIGFGTNFAFSKGGVFLDWLRDNIERFYYKEDYKKGENKPVLFKDLDKEFVVIATNLTTCEPYIFSKKSTPDFEVAQAVRISCSMPGLLTPVEKDSYLLSDGDIMKSGALWKLCNMEEYEDCRVIEFRLEGITNNKTPKKFMDYANTVYSCMTNYSTDFIMDVYAHNDRYDYVKIDTKGLLLVDFNISREQKEKLIQLGYLTTQRFLTKELKSKHKFLYGMYSEIYHNLITSEIFLKKNNILQAKNAYLETFPIICENVKNIDFTIYREILRLKNIFFANISESFFGLSKLNNKKLVFANFSQLLTKLESRCKELSNSGRQ